MVWQKCLFESGRGLNSQVPLRLRRDVRWRDSGVCSIEQTLAPDGVDGNVTSGEIMMVARRDRKAV